MVSPSRTASGSAAHCRPERSFRSRAFRLPTTALLEAVPPLRRFGDASYGWDAALLRRFPGLARYATIRVLELIRR